MLLGIGMWIGLWFCTSTFKALWISRGCDSFKTLGSIISFLMICFEVTFIVTSKQIIQKRKKKNNQQIFLFWIICFEVTMNVTSKQIIELQIMLRLFHLLGIFEPHPVGGYGCQWKLRVASGPRYTGMREGGKTLHLAFQYLIFMV